MHIGVDISGVLPTGRHLRGIDRYAHQWISSLAERLPESQIFLYHPQGAVFDRASTPAADNIHLRSVPALPQQWGKAQEAMLSGNLDRLDVYVQTHPFDIGRRDSLPRRSHSPVPLASIFYDFIPLLRPTEYPLDPPTEQDYRAKIAVLSQYDLLLAISKSSQRECVVHMPFPAARAPSIGCGASEGLFRPPVREEMEADLKALARWGVSGPYFLFVGHPHERRKNFACLVEAAANLPPRERDACRIVLVSPGPEAAIQPVLRQAEARGVRVVWADSPDDRSLRILYQRCRATVVPALHEGFGLPVLEAMQCGAPVLAADATSLPEAGGDAALYFDPEAPLTLTARLAELLNGDDAFREELGRRGVSWAAEFTWARVADASAAALAPLVETPRKETTLPFPPPSLQAPGRCWIDATMLTRCVIPSGIPRMVASLVARWPEDLRPRLRFFQYVDGVGFQTVEAASLFQRAEAYARAGGGGAPPPAVKVESPASAIKEPSASRGRSRLGKGLDSVRDGWRLVRQTLGLRRGPKIEAPSLAPRRRSKLRKGLDSVRDGWRLVRQALGLRRGPKIEAPSLAPRRRSKLRKGLDSVRDGWRSIRESLGLRRPRKVEAPPPPAPQSEDLGWTAQDVVLLPGGHFPPEGFFAELIRQQGKGAAVWTLLCDLLPEFYPQYFDPPLVAAYRDFLRNTLRTTGRVIAISEHTRRDLLSFCRQESLPTPETAVIRLGDELPSDETSGDDCGPLAERFGDASFVLCVSRFDRRKNQELIYQVWRKLVRDGRPAPHLVFVSNQVSGRHELVDEIFRDPLLAEKAHLVPGVSESQLRWLYRHSEFVMYPSIYEGWGLPVAEALASGKYCIASNASSIPEVGGELVDYHDPFSVQECYDLVVRAIEDDAWVRRREDRVKREYRTTSWAESAARIAAVLHPTCNTGRRRAAA